jgi:hypothetical protein
MFSCVPYHQTTHRWSEPYHKFNQYDNATLTITRDDGKNSYLVSYGNATAYNCDTCELCGTTKGGHPFSYLESEVMQEYVIHLIENIYGTDGDFQVFVNEATPWGLIPIVCLCDPCKINMINGLSLFDVGVLDKIEDELKCDKDLMKVCSGGKQKSFQFQYIQIAMAIANAFDIKFQLMKKSYHQSFGWTHYLFGKISKGLGY